MTLHFVAKGIQFDKPIAGTQLQQKKLAEMITEITKAQLLTWRLGVLKMKEERQLLKFLWPKKQCRHGN
jgi:alkylation response protein AidB-like acyl-CoA dehydrogenase